MKIVSVDRGTSSILATTTNQILKTYADDNFVGLRTTSPIQILSSYSSEIVAIQKLPIPVAIIIKSADL
jgi:hypothetical protein